MKYLLLLGFVGVANAITLGGVECPVTDGELGPCCPTGEIAIPVDITSIGDQAFDNCKTITSVTFPEGLISIGSNAFSSTEFDTMVAPSSLTSIGSSAFYLAGLKKLDFSAVTGVLAIGSSAFKYNYNLDDITFPKEFTSGSGAFNGVTDSTLVTYLGGKKGHGYDIVPSCQSGCNEIIHGCTDKAFSNFDHVANRHNQSLCESSTRLRPEGSSYNYYLLMSKLIHYEVAVVDSQCTGSTLRSLGTKNSQWGCADACYANRGAGIWGDEYNSTVGLTGFQWKIPTGACHCLSTKCGQEGVEDTGTIGYNFILKEGITDTDDYKVLVRGKCDYEISDANDCKQALVDLEEVPNLAFISSGGTRPLTILSKTDSAACCYRGLSSETTYWINTPISCGPNRPNDKCTANYPCICKETDPSVGCTDPLACNHVTTATTDDGSCRYAETNYNCNDECVNDADNDLVCDENEVPGCTDPEADNHAITATEDNGSCEYTDLCAGLELTYRSKCGCGT